MRRRTFLKRALWVPPLFAIGRAKGQALTLTDSAFVGSLNQEAASSPASFSDDFNRADADPMSNPASGGTWDAGPGASGPPKIVSNALASTDGTVRVARVSTPAFSANQACTGIGVSSNGTAVMVRIASDSSCSGYMLYFSNLTTLEFYKVTDSGSISLVKMGASVTVGSMSSPTLKLTATGGATTTIEGFLNGSSIGTRDDSSSPYTSGQPGLYFQAARSINAMEAADL